MLNITCDEDNDVKMIHADCDFFKKFLCVPSDDNYPKMFYKPLLEYYEEIYDIDFTKKAGFKLQEKLLSCQWLNKKENVIMVRNCSQPKFIREITKDKYPSACYSLESEVGNSEYAAEYLHLGSQVKILLKWRRSEYIRQSRVMHVALSRSYFVSIHSPGKPSNPFMVGFEIQQQNHYRVRVSQIDRVRLPSPYSTDCFDYIDAWKKNGGKGPLNEKDCHGLCEIDKSFDKLGCVPYHVAHPHDKPLCGNKKINDDALDKDIDLCAGKCKTACQETEYIPNVRIAYKLDVAETIKTYGTPYIVSLDIHFDPSNSTKISDIPVYESVEFFSYIGGYMGIWLGWSLAAIIELLEILFYILISYIFS